MYCVYKTNVFLITLLEYKLPDHYNIKYIFEEIHAVLNSFWIQYAGKQKSVSIVLLKKSIVKCSATGMSVTGPWR